MQKPIRRKDIYNLLPLFGVYTLALLLFSCFTSPLFPNLLGVDSAIFTLLGKGLLNGKEMYVGLFDHKGPFIFFFDALGYLMGGRNGIFVLQCLCGFVTVAFLYFTGRILRADNQKITLPLMLLIFVLGMSTFLYTCEGGNLTEEYSLPFIAACCYMFVSYVNRAEKDAAHPPLYAFFYGVSLAVISLMRLNNAATIGAGVLFVFIYLCYRKQGKNLVLNLLAGIGGMAIVWIPVFLYFYLHGSLDEMIYATFLHNFTIVGNTGHDSIFSSRGFITLYAPMILSAALLAAEVIRNRKISAMDGLLGCLLVTNAACLLIANRFPHYFTIFCPVYLLFLFRYLRIHAKSVLFIAAVLCALLHLLPAAQRTVWQWKTVYVDHNPRYETVAADMQKIPEDERDSVIGFEIMAQDYLAGDILPCYKYYTLQNTWAITSPHIVNDFVEWVDQNEPLWVIVAAGEENPDLFAVLQDKYEVSHENAYMTYYRLQSIA